ncbi:alcohol dehydrogenase [Halopseudomonas oceani]|uniref:PQQ-dependent dehydrogenase, methanol/ethanol family n=1 Tax=Halopseudomonas oceani TaxID=1708783 RepID=A0A2P4EX29_9GAMM|nr:PQQ-dependent dehydrogenase, methanol/ethanol family [Halopseudomonas oceani]POB04567.1 PQQ-dependent dehydrogenase, methanol/ethanol family [Halopseudomonas oceani]GGE39135.1 alcohol dehydrogenase [Halopseudomonas oceani]
MKKLIAFPLVTSLLGIAAAVHAGVVDTAAMLAVENDGSEWLSYDRTWSQQRFSPLQQITTENVDQLGLAWSIDLDNTRGLEATPLYHEGVLYTSLSWSRVLAVDAETGNILWSYDPGVDKSGARHACCDAVNRGVALWKGKVYVGTLDGRLVALDAKTGEPVWTQQTTDPSKPYTITGAPRVLNDMVLIGNGGAEYGVRGYFSAYDAATGEMRWRFYTVPSDPAEGPQATPALEEALKTWSDKTRWDLGGGGTSWDSMAYDPKLNLLYVGTGNGSPWNREIRSPGGGDNLYLSSILALRPETGELVWYYQSTPGESWDYTATQQLTLAELEIDGKPRQVIMQAPKNGFFYVLDRATGELLSAEKFGKVTWAEKIDMATGRPVEVPGSRYESGEPVTIWPSPLGAHNWHSMSYSPLTGLVYIPYQEMPATYANEGGDFVVHNGFNTGAGLENRELPREYATGALIAWDPVKQAPAWRVERPNHWNGGTLVTAGNLVFQGTSAGQLEAYSADMGAPLWHFPTQTGVIAAPMTYQHNGEQYIALMAGWGGSGGLFGGDAVQAAGARNVSRMMVFKLGGKAQLSAPPAAAPLPDRVPQPVVAAASDIDAGSDLYASYCMICHGVGTVGNGILPDLRYSSDAIRDAWEAIVLHGAFQNKGMASFADSLSAEQAQQIKLYIMQREYESWMSAKQTEAE